MTIKLLNSLLLATGAVLSVLERGPQPSKNRTRYRNLPATSRDVADDTTRRYLTYVVLPLWGVTGFLDWLWHRQTKIETTSGVKESILHLIMISEVGIPVLTGLFLEMNAGALALMGAGWLMHELTVAWDVNYSISRRKILPREQHTHSYQQTIPFDVVAIFACLHPEQFMALFGLGPEKPDFKLRFRKSPAPLKHFATIVGGAGLISVVPHVEELWRCYRAERDGLAKRDIPKCARELYAS